MKIGDYVRNENGLIGKIIGFKGDMVETDNKRLITYKSNHSECKIKERPIDLIEAGDYVNGSKVTSINNNKIINNIKYENGVYTEDASTFGESFWKEEDIKSIVTREQMESVEYRL